MVGVWAVASALLWWPQMREPWRRTLALVASGSGLVFLIHALGSHGLREAPTTTAYLLGSSYVTGQASAAASLPFFLATGVCLALGTAGLAVTDDRARWLGTHWLRWAIGLGLVITAVRFGLERVAAPRAWAYAVGITWLAPLVGVFAWLNLRREGRATLGPLLRSLVVYAFSVRLAVAALMVVATRFSLGSHYDVSRLVRVTNEFTGKAYVLEPGSLRQIMTIAVVPQLTFWPVYTIVAGLVGAGVTAAVLRITRSRSRPSAVVEALSMTESAG